MANVEKYDNVMGLFRVFGCPAALAEQFEFPFALDKRWERRWEKRMRWDWGFIGKSLSSRNYLRQVTTRTSRYL